MIYNIYEKGQAHRTKYLNNASNVKIDIYSYNL